MAVRYCGGVTVRVVFNAGAYACLVSARPEGRFVARSVRLRPLCPDFGDGVVPGSDDAVDRVAHEAVALATEIDELDEPGDDRPSLLAQAVAYRGDELDVRRP